MTQSKKDNEYTITLDDYVSEGDITINLDNTYGATTTYWNGGSVTDVVSDGTFTITDDATTISIGDWDLSGNFGPIDIEGLKAIHPTEVERMCKEYPSLEKVWRNFKSVYDMVKQDYEGKKKAGEIDDDIPF